MQASGLQSSSSNAKSKLSNCRPVLGTSKSSEAASISLPSQLKKQTAIDRERFVWRTDLSRSSPYWKGWYQGLSELFLSLRIPKILMLAGTDRLDKTLLIGQMQGKFQMSLLPEVSGSLWGLQHFAMKCCYNSGAGAEVGEGWTQLQSCCLGQRLFRHFMFLLTWIFKGDTLELDWESLMP